MSKTVLIVDDDPNVVDLLVNIMTMLGVEARTAPNGREALNAIAKSAPDAVILDLMMPVMDGFTMLMQLRKEEVGQKMPVIVLSALADQKGTMDKLPGITGTITKGKFSLLELREMLGKAGVLETSPAPIAKPAESPSAPPAPAAPPNPAEAQVTPPLGTARTNTTNGSGLKSA